MSSDTSTNKVTATVNVGETPFGVAVNPQGTKAYITCLSGVYEIDTATDIITGILNDKHASGISFTPDGSKLYLADYESKVHVIDIDTGNITATVQVGSGPIALGQFIGSFQYNIQYFLLQTSAAMLPRVILLFACNLMTVH